MIIEMTKIRVLGPVGRLAATVRVLQDAGVVQVIDASCPLGMSLRADSPSVRRRRRHLQHALANVEEALATLSTLGAPVADRAGPPREDARGALLAGRLREQLHRLAARRRALVDERDLLRAYEPLFADLDTLIAGAQRVSVYLLRLHGAGALAELRAVLSRAFGDDHLLRSYSLASGESVVLLIVPAAFAEQIDRQLADARVERAPLPAGLDSLPLAEGLRRIRPRLAEVMHALEAIRDEAVALARAHGDDLTRARRGFHDALVALDAEEHAATSSRAFMLEGWMPARERRRLATALRAADPTITTEEIARDEWAGEDVPVVLANPRIFAPFEALSSLLPLPRYGSVDPTPFVAVFFPMLFGVIVGDVGYGLVLIGLALALRLASRRTAARNIAKIAVAVAIYTILFGFCYGELFGDLGTRWFAMRPLWFDRREAVLAFLVLALALGTAHLVIGLVVATANRWRRDRRQAIGRGLTAVMLLLLAVALLALFDRVPAMFLMPTVIALLVTFAVIIVLEGATAILEFMSVANHVLSYARVMALGTASVMLAVVANRMQGAFGSAALGIAFALVFHLVNFAITLFSPTIHVMRLHYVEFFGTFFEPGGGPYRPLRHWSPGPAVT